MAAKAKAPRPGTTPSSNPAQESKEVTVLVDGKSYPLRMDDVSALHSSAFRKATGMSLRSAFVALQSDADIDIVAGLMWLSRVTNGEPRLTYEEVAGEIGYDIDVDFKPTVEDDAGDDSPEA